MLESVTELPFNRHVGIRKVASGDGLLELPSGGQFLNHIGTVHAGALLALAEACSGEFLLQSLSGETDIIPVVRRVDAKFRKPAKGRITAAVTTPVDVVDNARRELTAKRRAQLTIDVNIHDETGQHSLTAHFEWFVSRLPTTPDSSESEVVFSLDDIHHATEDDVGDIIDLLEESSVWMISIGIDRWQPGIHAAAEQQLRNDINNGSVYVWKPADAVLATIRLTQVDPVIWPNDSTAALYVHKMSVRRSLKGRGFGRSLLQWAEQQAIRNGVEHLRLDCWTDNPRLCRFYKDCGFRPVRTTIVDGWNHQLFERCVRQGSGLRPSTDSSVPTKDSSARLQAGKRVRFREMQLVETRLMIRYFLDADIDFLYGMGVDPKRMPTEAAWFELLQQDWLRPIHHRHFFYLIWESDGVPFGHCNINKVSFGESAFMHLHIWNAKSRRQGCATQLLRPSIAYFFERFELRELLCEPYALNPAPNRTLPKAGFRLLKTYETTPGWINYHQPVNQWILDRETAFKETALPIDQDIAKAERQ